MSRTNNFVIGIPDEWGDLNPSIQNSVYADPIISSQFETLIRVDKNGMIEPLAASSWYVTPKFDEIRFKIDTKRRFSNGKFLTAQDVKKTWEKGLLLAPKDFNGAFKDFLSRVVGYESFPKTKIMSGLIVDGDYFIIKFKSSFRSALGFLSNSRFGVFLEEYEHFLGTGQYNIIYNDGKVLEMVPNEYFPVKGFSKIKMIVVKPEEAEAKLKTGTIQAYLFAEKAIIKSCSQNIENVSLFHKLKSWFTGSDNIKCISGREGRHEYVTINGLSDSIFNNPNYRKAIQALLVSEIQKVGLPEFMKVNNVRMDSQVYLKFQPGRISDTEAEQIISEGNKYIPELIKAAQNKPICLLTYDKPNWIQDILEKKGLKFTSNSGYVPKNVVLEFYRRTKNIPDMLVGGVSLANGDPDGLYHSLGATGSHNSLVTARPMVRNLLESGRSIIDRKQVDEHYKNVSRAVLKEVPFVHIGFSLGVVAYRADKVKVNTAVKNREVYGLNIFEPY